MLKLVLKICYYTSVHMLQEFFTYNILKASVSPQNL